MTTVYLIHRAQSDNTVRDAKSRPLTNKKLADCRNKAQERNIAALNQDFMDMTG